MVIGRDDRHSLTVPHQRTVDRFSDPAPPFPMNPRKELDFSTGGKVSRFDEPGEQFTGAGNVPSDRRESCGGPSWGWERAILVEELDCPSVKALFLSLATWTERGAAVQAFFQLLSRAASSRSCTCLGSCLHSMLW
jgi:hypothetical protein